MPRFRLLWFGGTLVTLSQPLRTMNRVVPAVFHMGAGPS
jgi:hypothetical protein